MEINLYASEMANSLSDMGPYAVFMSNECEKYGSTWGCNGNCPVFAKGKCKIEDIDGFRKQILETDDFNNFSIEELNELYPQLNLEYK